MPAPTLQSNARPAAHRARHSAATPMAAAPRPRRIASYREAGVDIERTDAWLARMAPLIRSTRRPEVLSGRGQFAGLFRLAGTRYRDPVLVASADGVGTKLKVAREVDAHEAIGIDLVAMNVNDVLVYGAEPLFFLDYLAVGKLHAPSMQRLLHGVVKGCRLSGCALLGGETAEMPGVYRRGDFDVAGFCVGIVERSRMIDGSRVRAGDAIVGLASSGVHANGFSLVRRVFKKPQIRQLNRQLLAPTRIYVKPVLAALRSIPIHAIAHVTGGGLTRRLRSLTTGRRDLRARLFPKSWPVPPVFQTIQQAGRIHPTEMACTFNMGIGMTLVCRPADVSRLLRFMRRAGVPAWAIGTIERRTRKSV